MSEGLNPDLIPPYDKNSVSDPILAFVLATGGQILYTPFRAGDRPVHRVRTRCSGAVPRAINHRACCSFVSIVSVPSPLVQTQSCNSNHTIILL